MFLCEVVFEKRSCVLTYLYVIRATPSFLFEELKSIDSIELFIPTEALQHGVTFAGLGPPCSSLRDPDELGLSF